MDTQQYINKKVELYDLLLIFIESSDDDDSDYRNLLDFFNKEEYQANKEKLELFLRLIANIANNHHRESNFFTKIIKIFLFMKNSLKQIFSDAEIFEIYKSNKLILLFLFKNEIITFDESIFRLLKMQSNFDDYCRFFFPEIKPFLEKEKVKELESEVLGEEPDMFSEKRNLGENENYICKLIREDLIEEFVTYVNHTNYPLDSEIKKSFYETNSFLIEREPKLIEYAAFFGAFQICQFLKYKEVQLTKSLWLYAIHSNNADVVHFPEDNHVVPEDETYGEVLLESIKCHHNNVANYIKSNLMEEVSDRFECEEKITSIQNYNYHFFPNDFSQHSVFYALCQTKHYELADIFINSKRTEYETRTERKNEIDFIYFLLSKSSHFDNKFLDNGKNLTEIIVPQSVTTIDECAFKECKSLRRILISSVTSIKKSAFQGCSKLEEISLPYCLTSIEEYAFSGCSSLKNIIIPSSVISISDYVFNECFSLENIYIPSSVTSIGEGSFNRCKSLVEITIPSSVTSIGNGSFNECISLRRAIIPPSLKVIEDHLFNFCESLERISIPSSVTTIGYLSFSGCSKLKTISFESPSSLISVGNCSFNKCCSITEITFPSSLTSIEFIAFSECLGLTQVAFEEPSSLVSIGPSAFEKCRKLEKIHIPPSVIFIGKKAFDECRSLKNINIPPLIKVINESAFQYCYSLSKIIFDNPPSLVSINKCAFLYCMTLRKLIVPSSVQSIGDESFQNCFSLKKVEIPDSVTSVGKKAFNNCTKLEKIKIPASLNAKDMGISPDSKVKIVYT